MGTSVFPSGLIHQASATLTNDQILTLPTVAVQVLAAPGANKITVLRQCFAVIDTTAGDYGNLDGTACVAQLVYPSLDASYYINQNEGGSFFDSGAIAYAQLDSIAYADANGSLYTISGDAANFVNTALSFVVFNGVSGNFNGGNAANTLKLYITYMVLNLNTGMFE